MLNINAKKLNLIVLNIAIIFAIIFSNFYVYAISDETKEVSEDNNNNKIESQISEYDEDIYSVESIVYNKVPLFDINVFYFHDKIIKRNKKMPKKNKINKRLL